MPLGLVSLGIDSRPLKLDFMKIILSRQIDAQSALPEETNGILWSIDFRFAQKGDETVNG